jgi:hypothetical protein
LTNLGELLLYISEQSLFFLEYAPSFGFGDWVLYLGFLRWLLMLSRCLYILSSITIGVSVSLAQYALLLLLLRASLGGIAASIQLDRLKGEAVIHHVCLCV